MLVVDDEPLICLAVEDVLRATGAGTDCVQTDQAAYAALREHHFDALIVDIDLREGTTGFDVARFARGIDPDLPVIYLTGGSRESIGAFGVAGAEYVAKPLDEPRLLATVERMTRRG